MEKYTPVDKGKSVNSMVQCFLSMNVFQLDVLVIEKPICQRHSGASVSETAIRAGIFAGMVPGGADVDIYMINRSKVRGRLAHRGGDSHVISALVERFAPGVRNKGKGIKKDPGYFYGFTGDAWQAYALGVVFLDLFYGSNKDQQYLMDNKLF